MARVVLAVWFRNAWTVTLYVIPSVRMMCPCLCTYRNHTVQNSVLYSRLHSTDASHDPCLVVPCVKEIERRGSTEVVLYRVPGLERDVKALKERFFKGRGAPDLSNTDLPEVCGALKEFLRCLREPHSVTMA